MPLAGWEAYSVHLLACDVQEFGCTIPEDACKLRWNLNDNRLWIGIAASSIELGLGAEVRGRFHMTILTAERVSCSPGQKHLEQLDRSLKRSLSTTPVFGAGGPDPILVSDLPHRVIVTLSVRSALHTKLFGARTTFLQQVACGRPDDRTSFHLSIDYFAFRPGIQGIQLESTAQGIGLAPVIQPQHERMQKALEKAGIPAILGLQMGLIQGEEGTQAQGQEGTAQGQTCCSCRVLHQLRAGSDNAAR